MVFLIHTELRCTVNHTSDSQIYFWNRTLHVSDWFSVHHQKSSTVYTAIGICHTGFADCLLATGQQNLFYSKNKFEKLVHLVGLIMRIYQDARSSECHISLGMVGCEEGFSYMQLINDDVII